MAYLRIATHPRIFAAPLSPDEALGNVAALAGMAHVRAVSEQQGFLDAYKRVAGGTPVVTRTLNGPSTRTFSNPLTPKVRVPACAGTAIVAAIRSAGR